MSPQGILNPSQTKCINSFIKHNPDLKLKHWSDQQVDEFIKENYDLDFYKNWLSIYPRRTE